MTTAKPKAYSYLRFSTPEQQMGDSTRRQMSMAQEYAARHGYDLDSDLRYTYHDLGVSAFRGANSKAGRLADFLEAVDAGEVPPGSVLLVEALDRLTRLTPMAALNVLQQIISRDVKVVTLSDGRVYDEAGLEKNPVELMVAIMLFIRANEESATKARRLKQAWEGKRLKAGTRPLTSVVPAWLKLNRETGALEAIPERVTIVRRIFGEYLAGRGHHAIAEGLINDGVPCFGRATHWHRTYVSKILNNSATYGVFTPHTYEFINNKRSRQPLSPMPGYYPAAVTQETFDEAALLKGERPAPKSPSRVVVNLFAGLALCPSCGSTMTRVNKGATRRSNRPKLVCVKAKAGAGCEYRSIDLAMVEDALISKASEIVWLAPSGDVTNEARLAQVLNNIDATEDAIGNLVAGIEAGPSSALTKRLRKLEAGLTPLEAERDALLDVLAMSTGAALQRHIDGLGSALNADPIDKPKANAALRKVLSGIVVNGSEGLLTLNWKQGGTSEVQFRWPLAAPTAT